MNTKPDDVMLALWLDDELHGEEFAAMEAWAAAHPEQLAAREETRAYRACMAGVMPREVEPPYADFFNTRIRNAIQESRVAAALEPAPAPAAIIRVRWWRSAWLMPTAAAAGMALAFWGGTHVNRPGGLISYAPTGTPAPLVYTPDNEVKANYFPGRNGSSTVIVLDGVSAIPDSTDFRETAWNSSTSEIDSTASNEDGAPSAN